MMPEEDSHLAHTSSSSTIHTGIFVVDEQSPRLRAWDYSLRSEKEKLLDGT